MMDRLRLVLIVFFALFSGCVSYIWGNRWEIASSDSWKETDRDISRNDAQNGDLKVIRCHNKDLFLGTNQIKTGSAIGPVIPLSFNKNEQNEQNEKDTALQIFIKYKNAEHICINNKKAIANIYIDNSLIKDYKVYPGHGFSSNNWEGSGRDYCLITVNHLSNNLDQATLKLNDKVFGCHLPEITLNKTKYRCAKSSVWGGTDCGVD